MSANRGHERLLSHSQRRQTVQRPGADERLWKAHVLEQDRFDPLCLGWTPPKERQRANDLQPDLPLVALRQRTDEDLLVRSDPVRMDMGQLLEEVDRPLG